MVDVIICNVPNANITFVGCVLVVRHFNEIFFWHEIFREFRASYCVKFFYKIYKVYKNQFRRSIKNNRLENSR